MAQIHGPILPWGLVKQNLSMNESNTEFYQNQTKDQSSQNWETNYQSFLYLKRKLEHL